MKIFLTRTLLILFFGMSCLSLVAYACEPVDTPEFMIVEAVPITPIVEEKPVVVHERMRVLAIEEEKEPTYAYTTTNLNVRIEPDTSADIIDTLLPNVKVEYIGTTENEWTSIRVNDMTYYVYSAYISEEEPEEIITLESLASTRYSIEQEEEQFIFQDKFENWTLTAYCACEKCCGKWSKYKKTASGTTPEEGRTVACVSLEFGTIININGEDYIVEDTGRLKDTQIDIYFESHQEALEFGRQKGTVYLISEPEEE